MEDEKEKQVALIDQAPSGEVFISVFQSEKAFVAAQRMAKMLCASDLVPKEYRTNIANAIIALEMAQRIGASPLAVMQQTYIVHGKPSWSSQFIIAALNSCGRFSPLRFDMDGTEGAEDRSCAVWAYDKKDKEKLEGPRVSMAMAGEEGWIAKNGSKWKTMPELMLRYRAATFFGRLYAPDVLMGMQTKDEIEDISVSPEDKLKRETAENANTGPVIDIKDDGEPAFDTLVDDPGKPEEKDTFRPAPEETKQCEEVEKTVECPNREGTSMLVSFCDGIGNCNSRVGCPAFADATAENTTTDRKPGF